MNVRPVILKEKELFSLCVSGLDRAASSKGQEDLINKIARTFARFNPDCTPQWGARELSGYKPYEIRDALNFLCFCNFEPTLPDCWRLSRCLGAATYKRTLRAADILAAPFGAAIPEAAPALALEDGQEVHTVNMGIKGVKAHAKVPAKNRGEALGRLCAAGDRTSALFPLFVAFTDMPPEAGMRVDPGDYRTDDDVVASDIPVPDIPGSVIRVRADGSSTLFTDLGTTPSDQVHDLPPFRMSAWFAEDDGTGGLRPAWPGDNPCALVRFEKDDFRSITLRVDGMGDETVGLVRDLVEARRFREWDGAGDMAEELDGFAVTVHSLTGDDDDLRTVAKLAGVRADATWTMGVDGGELATVREMPDGGFVVTSGLPGEKGDTLRLRCGRDLGLLSMTLVGDTGAEIPVNEPPAGQKAVLAGARVYAAFVEEAKRRK